MFEGNVDLLVLTVTSPEQQAAIKVIEKAAGKAMEQKDCLDTRTKKFAVTIHYVEWDGFFESKERGPAKIALACATEMGRESSAQGVVTGAHLADDARTVGNRYGGNVRRVRRENQSRRRFRAVSNYASLRKRIRRRKVRYQRQVRRNRFKSAKNCSFRGKQQ